MQKMQLFSAIADFYEYSMKLNCDYAKWADYVADKLRALTGKTGKGIDAACGSGYFTRALKRAGYNVCGVDCSAEMLTAAMRECAKDGLVIDFRKEDMSNLKSFEKVDFITVINDGINCIPPEKIEKTFRSFGCCLKKGGVLHFDVSSEYKLRNVIANQTFCEDDENYSYIWFNTLHEDRVCMDMSVFLRQGEYYKKTESSLTEYIYTQKMLSDALEKCGFNIVCVEGQSGEKLTGQSERLCFWAVKN